MKGVIAVEYVNRCIKFDLPNGTTADFLEEPMSKMLIYRQEKSDAPESCGFLLGYKNKKTKNITISDITVPQNKDIRKRCFCKLLDKAHFNVLKRSAKKGNYYMGVWHTHPQKTPEPSSVDWNDWNEVLHKDKTGAEYAFFVIIGTEEFRVWIGDYKAKEIMEIFETNISDGIYEKRC